MIYAGDDGQVLPEGETETEEDGDDDNSMDDLRGMFCCESLLATMYETCSGALSAFISARLPFL